MMLKTAAVAGLLAVSLAQDRSQQPPPRFRTGVDIVLLDVTVLDKDRRPVRGLKAGDFTILEDGNPQPIVSFDELDAPEPDGSLVPWMREVPPDVRTNSDDHRRIFLIVLDDATISFRYRDDVKRIGGLLIDRLGPADHAAIVFTGNNARSQDLTADRRALRQTVDRYVDTSMPGELRIKYALGTLRRAAQALMDIPHRRKAIIYVGSMAIPPALAGGELGIGELGKAREAAELQGDLAYDMKELIRHAQRSNVNIYTINPAGLETFATPGPDHTADTLLTVSNATGGFAVINSNTFEPQIRQLFRETGSYYLLGMQSVYRDGKFRRIEVRVNRPGLTVRTRNGYTAPRAEKEAREEKALPIFKAVSRVLPEPDVPIRVAVAPFALPGSDAATVAIVLGVQQPAPPGARLVENVDVLSTAFDMQYRSRGWFRQTAQLTLRPVEDRQDAKYEVFSKLTLKPGRYNLRFAVHSASLNKSGSVYQDVDIPDFSKAPVSLSGVVIGVVPALPSAPKDYLASVIPIAATTQRVFMRGHQPTAFMRVYQGGRRPPLAAALVTTIVDEADRTVHSSTEALAPERFGTSRAVDHRFDLPIDRLSPGAYMLRFSVSADRHSAVREVRFVVR